MEQGLRRTYFAVVSAAAVLVLALAGLPSATSASPGPRAAIKYAVLEGCGSGAPAADRLCLAYPSDCTANSSCTLAVTVRADPSDADKYLFEMAAQFQGYVSVALAETTNMGADSVVECIFDPDKRMVLLYQSLNRAKNPTTGKRGNARLPSEAQQGVTLTKQSQEDDVTSCTFSRDRVTTVGGKTYDLASGSWVLQAAAGNKINANSTIHHHTEWVVSPDKVKLSDTGLIDGSYGSRRDSSPSGAPASAATTTSLAAALAGVVTLAAVNGWW